MLTIAGRDEAGCARARRCCSPRSASRPARATAPVRPATREGEPVYAAAAVAGLARRLAVRGGDMVKRRPAAVPARRQAWAMLPAEAEARCACTRRRRRAQHREGPAPREGWAILRPARTGRHAGGTGAAPEHSASSSCSRRLRAARACRRRRVGAGADRARRAEVAASLRSGKLPARVDERMLPPKRLPRFACRPRAGRLAPRADEPARHDGRAGDRHLHREPGEWVGRHAGAGRCWRAGGVRFFVPQAQLAAAAMRTCFCLDGCGEPIVARVSFVSRPRIRRR